MVVIVSVVPCRGSDEATMLFVPLAEQSHSLLRSDRPFRLAEVQLGEQGAPRRGDRLKRRLGIDVSPAIDSILGFFNRHGVPLREQHDARSGSLVGVQAAFSVGRDVPAVNFNLGDRPVEPLGAFYSAEKGFRCALVWPVERFTLRLEGGEDSEFGYYGIAGLQWVHPRLPLAAGVGVPMNLRDAEGDVGVIVQFRMRLD
jgi:hypothetical protein